MNALTSNALQSQQLAIKKLKSKVLSNIEKCMFKNAQSLGEHLVCMTEGQDVESVHLLAKALFFGKQYHRTIHLLTEEYPTMLEKSIDNLLLASKSCFESKQFQKVLKLMIENDDLFVQTFLNNQPSAFTTHYQKELLQDQDYGLSFCLLRAQTYEMLENKIAAKKFYLLCLERDPYCEEAFDRLITNASESSGIVLLPQEKLNVRNSLLAEADPEYEFPSIDHSDDWLQWLYSLKFSIFMSIDQHVTLEQENRFVEQSKFYKLDQSICVMAALAQMHYNKHHYGKSYRLLHTIIEKDPYDMSNCMILYVEVMVALRKTSDLFKIAHQLVEAYPYHPISWFAVGCYYFAIQKYPLALKHFYKSANCAHGQKFLPAWIGIGHVFTMQEEFEQALTAYRTANRLFPSNHLPPLYMAMENVRVVTTPNILSLAVDLCSQSRDMNPNDPLVYNEIGSIYYQQKQFESALKCFLKALELCPFNENQQSTFLQFKSNVNSLELHQMIHREMEEQQQECQQYLDNSILCPILINLGHTYRKIKYYQQALEYYERALMLEPQNPTLYTSIGLTWHLQLQLDKAITFYHKALTLQYDDSVTADLLSKALQQFAALSK